MSIFCIKLSLVYRSYVQVLPMVLTEDRLELQIKRSVWPENAVFIKHHVVHGEILELSWTCGHFLPFFYQFSVNEIIHFLVSIFGFLKGYFQWGHLNKNLGFGCLWIRLKKTCTVWTLISTWVYLKNPVFKHTLKMKDGSKKLGPKPQFSFVWDVSTRCRKTAADRTKQLKR